jgi:hypothetical protein
MSTSGEDEEFLNAPKSQFIILYFMGWGKMQK